MIDLYVDSGSLPLFSTHQCKKLKRLLKISFLFLNVGNYSTYFNKIWQFYKNVQVNKLVLKMWPTPLVPKLIEHDKEFSLLRQESNTDIKFRKSLSWNLLSALPTVWKLFSLEML